MTDWSDEVNELQNIFLETTKKAEHGLQVAVARLYETAKQFVTAYDAVDKFRRKNQSIAFKKSVEKQSSGDGDKVKYPFRYVPPGDEDEE